MTADPLMVRFAAHTARVMGHVDAGRLTRHQALAALVSDALAASVADDVDPDTSDALLGMATEWASARARGLAGDLLLAERPVPDSPADLDGGA